MIVKVDPSAKLWLQCDLRIVYERGVRQRGGVLEVVRHVEGTFSRFTCDSWLISYVLVCKAHEGRNNALQQDLTGLTLALAVSRKRKRPCPNRPATGSLLNVLNILNLGMRARRRIQLHIQRYLPSTMWMWSILSKVRIL
jgi:hypothetical protein